MPADQRPGGRARRAATVLALAAILGGGAQALPDRAKPDDRPRRSFAVIEVEAGPLRVRLASIRF